jgi:uncharacterized protein (TIGR03067 family)
MMCFLTAALAFLGTPFALAAADDAAVRRELKALEGNWKVVAAVDGGRKFPPDRLPPVSFVLRADGTATVRMGAGESKVTFRIDPSKNPKTMDIVHQSGPGKGKKQFAIYKLENDRFTVIATDPGAKEEDRPRDFTKGRVLVFERVRGAGGAKSEFDGTWDLVYFERDGKEVKVQKGAQAVMTGNKFVVKAGDKVIAAGTSKLDPGKKPKAVDITYTQGPNKGQTFKGIYQVKGDTLKFCRAGSPDQARPTEFKTKPDSGQFVTVYQRAKR